MPKKTAPKNDLRLTVAIAGDGIAAEVYFGEFRAFCNNLAKCLKTSEEVVSGARPKIRYRIVRLESGSAVVELEAVRPLRGRDRRAPVLNLFRKTVTAIQTGKKLDRRIGPHELDVFKRLAMPVMDDPKRRVEIDGTTITDEYAANADRLLRGQNTEEGFVSGVLEQINVHEKNEFVLFPPIPGFRIRCEFPKAMLDSVRGALTQTVTVTGAMRFEEDRPFPSTVHVKKMDVHPPDDELPKLADLRGIGKGCTNGLTAVEYVRAIRDEE